MLDFLLAAWLAAVKWPLTIFIDAAFLRGMRRRVAPAFDAWAAKAAAGGPAAIARATAERVTYANDPLGGLLDYVAAPAVTWARRYGDCDDFAYLTAELLRRADVESWVVSYLSRNVKDSHVVCLFRNADGYGVLDQGLIRGPFRTLAEAADAGNPGAKNAARWVRRYGRGADLIGKCFLKR
jgi:transglutaminase-like putative cysteine protease